MKYQFLLILLLVGGVAGTINSLWCYYDILISNEIESLFEWYIVPAGFVHGSIVSLSIGVYLLFLKNLKFILKILCTLFLAWFVGYLCFNVIICGVNGDVNLSFSFEMSTELFSIPFISFGLVLIAFALLDSCKDKFISSDSTKVLLSTIISGIIGSLWWWIAYGNWHLSVLHGCIWGLLIGFTLIKFSPLIYAKQK